MTCQTKEAYFGEFLFFIFLKVLGTVADWLGFFRVPSAAALLELNHSKASTPTSII